MNSPSDNAVTIHMLASGSGGNSLVIRYGNTNLLVDAGLSCRELVRRLALIDLTPSDISAVIITHEHTDHVRGAGVLSRQHGVVTYMNGATLEAASGSIGDVPTAEVFSTGDLIVLGDLTLQTYPVLHDAADPIGLIVSANSTRIGIALDMGRPTTLVRERLRGSNALILEFNHDPEMLRQCPRPWELKQRILSTTGHMSNAAALDFLSELVHDHLSVVVLAHISREANSTELACSAVSARLREMGRSHIRVIPGYQNEIGDPIVI